jgi:Transposase DDE domain
MVDITEDANSEIITKMNVLPGNGDEGADTVDLILREEAAHGNDIDAVSTDGAGYRGDVLRELTDPEGLNMEAFVPPSEPRSPKGFPAELFVLEVIGGRATVSCPGGHTTTTRTRNTKDTGYQYRFDESQCSGCPKRLECLEKPENKARSVIKNDYEAEYKAAQKKAKTAEYKKVRREHPAIERKLGELVRHHGLRNSRYRGQSKVFYQSLMTGFVVNLKRIVKLLFDPPGTASEGAVRAELAGAR